MSDRHDLERPLTGSERFLGLSVMAASIVAIWAVIRVVIWLCQRVTG